MVRPTGNRDPLDRHPEPGGKMKMGRVREEHLLRKRTAGTSSRTVDLQMSEVPRMERLTDGVTVSRLR